MNIRLVKHAALLLLALSAGATSAYTITVSALPATVPADGKTLAQLTATVTDGGNPVQDALVTWSLPSGSLGTILDTSSRTDGSGKASSRLRTPINTGLAAVTAQVGADSGTVQVMFSGPASMVRFTTPIISYFLPADGQSKLACGVRVTDADGDPVADGTQVVFSVNGQTASSVARTYGGVAIGTITAASVAGENVITATSNGVSDTANVTFSDIPTMCVVRPRETSITAGSTTPCVLDALVVDSAGALLKDGASVGFSVSDGGGVLMANTGQVHAGVAEAFLIPPSSPGTATVTSTFGSQSGTCEIMFVGSADSVSVDGLLSAVPYGTNKGTRVSAVVFDSNGNPLPDGTVVDFTSTGGTTIDPKGIVQGGTAVVNLFGASSPVEATITASCGGKSGQGTVYFSGEPASITLVPDLGSVRADGSSATRIVANAIDSQGYPVPDGTVIAFQTSDSSSMITQYAATLNGECHATLVSAPQSSTATVAATSGSATSAGAVVHFAADPAVATLAANPSHAPGDGEARVVLTAAVVDANSRPVADGTPVTFSTNLGAFVGAVAGTSAGASTTVGGKATAVISSAQVGTATVMVSCGTATDSAVVTFE